MVSVVYLPPGSPVPDERHVVVIAHRDGVHAGGEEKGYFYDSAESDHGGSGPFDWWLSEAVIRAQRFAADRGLPQVIVRGRPLDDPQR